MLPSNKNFGGFKKISVGRDVVLIRNGKKSYGTGKNRKEVLKDINMTVAEGSM
jgi:hypothetical protein